MKTGTLAGRSIVVTGGGTGLGAAIAQLAAREGAKVTVSGRTEGTLRDTAAAIAEAGGTAQVVVGDVTVEADVARLVAEAAEFGGGIHGFVANAGGGSPVAPLHLQDLDAFERVLRLNTVGTFLCIKHAVPHLARAEGGSFVGMSSIAGHVTHPLFGGYPTGKAGIESLIRNAADEYGRFGVRFNGVQPGYIQTDVMATFTPGTPIYDSYVSQTPLGGVGRPDDVAQVVRFLLSDQSRWMTGQLLAVDGGNSLRRGPDFTSLAERRLGPEGLDPAKA